MIKIRGDATELVATVDALIAERDAAIARAEAAEARAAKADYDLGALSEVWKAERDRALRAEAACAAVTSESNAVQATYRARADVLLDALRQAQEALACIDRQGCEATACMESAWRQEATAALAAIRKVLGGAP